MKKCKVCPECGGSGRISKKCNCFQVDSFECDLDCDSFWFDICPSCTDGWIIEDIVDGDLVECLNCKDAQVIDGVRFIHIQMPMQKSVFRRCKTCNSTGKVLKDNWEVVE